MDKNECIFGCVLVIGITFILALGVPSCIQKNYQARLDCIKGGQPPAACQAAFPN